MPFDFTALLVFLLGLSVGSFLNVFIYRMDQLDSIITERSRCPRCKKTLSWWELIPVLSYLLLRGKCYNCRKPISMQYPLVELATALYFILLYWNFGLTWYTLFLAAVGSLLIVAATYDLINLLVPDEALLPAIVLAMLYPLTQAGYAWTTGAPSQLPQLGSLVLGALIGAGSLGILVALGRGKWMGDGDIRVGAVMGLILGYPRVLPGLFIAFLAGALISLGLLLVRQKKMKDVVPFVPFLVFGTFVALFWGNQIISWYTSFAF